MQVTAFTNFGGCTVWDATVGFRGPAFIFLILHSSENWSFKKSLEVFDTSCRVSELIFKKMSISLRNLRMAL